MMEKILKLLTPEEQASLSLRALYEAHGFSPYRMSKFEEYDLYMQNKDFLVSPQVITFTDTDGKLMALKPDVTLSIVKNFDPQKGEQKVYYNETVYRPALHGGFREILQSGVECLGSVTFEEEARLLNLAAEGLQTVGGRFVLSVSHLGIVDGFLEELDLQNDVRDEVLNCIRAKKTAGALALSRAAGADERVVESLGEVMALSVPLFRAAEKLEGLAPNDLVRSAAASLSLLCEQTKKSDSIVFDLSVLPNRRFYNGLVFSGYVAGVSSQVLSGGRYDKLLSRMHKDGGAIGFALYLDRLTSGKKEARV